jgi:hypothetical protein
VVRQQRDQRGRAARGEAHRGVVAHVDLKAMFESGISYISFKR